MAATRFSRRYVSLLSHVLGWGLLGYLLFFSQSFNSEIHLPDLFWVRQGIFFGLMVGTFYLNSQLLVPRFLLSGQTGRYLLVLAGIVISTLFILWCIETWFNLPILLHRAFHPDGKGQPKFYGWIQPAVFTILLVLGISTSMALLQKWQTDTNLRLALEQAKTTSELSFLKAQINPHFFFNTLNNIYALTLLDVETAREALHRLSRMMRYVLYDTQAGTTLLSKELSFVGDYIQLMQLRLTDKVTVTLNSPNPLHDQPIAPMLLLPFVENAFKHGVSALQPSWITITLQQQQNKLLLDVRNTLFAEKTPSLEAGNGIGLTNTRRRLDLLYPDQYVLAINEHTPAGEYHVHLTLNLS
ncbi:sensor histidine kinase [Spirosoma endbachense]|uniref:Sensor histidine kinase n=1 Tax=Spirosoma endbachense TaxID=2666025 RepID=A0A6P1VYC7_9BACT|nr:histidine kinase [Spirosoma endbachense]QHV96767.1 sensor histidine kinase [Spirosoma endbachense]